MIFPIIMICLCLVGGITAYFFIKQTEKNKYKLKDTHKETANDFINVKDIKGNFLYTIDNQILCYLKINPISIDLFSKNEKQNLARTLTAELSNINYPFKFIAVSRPVDITPQINELTTLLQEVPYELKKIVKSDINEISNFAMSGEVIERQFYLIIWDKNIDGSDRELLNRARILSDIFNTNKIQCEIIGEQDIVRLCNLVNNPSYSHIENHDFESTIPIITGGI